MYHGFWKRDGKLSREEGKTVFPLKMFSVYTSNLTGRNFGTFWVVITILLLKIAKLIEMHLLDNQYQEWLANEKE